MLLVIGKADIYIWLLASAGMITDVITFEVGAVLDDAHWQAPVYCFSKAEAEPQIHNRRSSFSLDLEAAIVDDFRWTLMSEMR